MTNGSRKRLFVNLGLNVAGSLLAMAVVAALGLLWALVRWLL
jgi:hypothetical protein